MKCRVCDGEHLELVLSLGHQPWCNHFLQKSEIGSEPLYPLELMYCHDCGTSQLNHTVPKEIMFGDHTYLSGMTKTLSAHFKKEAQLVVALFDKAPKYLSILDIGSNDGTQLQHYKNLGCKVLGVEPSVRTAKIANEKGLRTYQAFFNEKVSKQIVSGAGKPFDIINASGVFFHLEELHSVTRGIKLALAKDGTFIVQFLYMKKIIENLAFDQIYHEHLLYYTLKTISHLLKRYGLELYDARLEPIHGGSIIAYVTHAGEKSSTSRLCQLIQREEASGINSLEAYKKFARDVAELKQKNLEFLIKAKKEGKRIFGMGAPVKGNTLLNYFGVGPEMIECLLEINELRRDTWSPGMHIPVLMEKLIQDTPDIYYVLAWNFKQEILHRNADLIAKGVEFYFPINPE